MNERRASWFGGGASQGMAMCPGPEMPAVPGALHMGAEHEAPVTKHQVSLHAVPPFAGLRLAGAHRCFICAW